MRAVLYCRISVDRSGERLGVERQTEDGRALIAQRGWTLVGEQVDNDMSAASGKRRPGFDAALQAIEAGEADALVAWSLDRLTRNRRDQVRLVETLEARRATVALVRGSDLDMSTASGRMVAGILGEVARHEVDHARDRMVRAHEQAAAAGTPHSGGPVPFGFEADRVTHHPAAVAALRDAYAVVLAGGTLAGIAREWNAAGLGSGRSRLRGRPAGWTPETVKRVLVNPRNAGLRARHGEVVGPAVWRPIVDEATWRAVCAVLEDPARARPAHGRTLLGGLATCAVCDGPVEGNHRRDEASYRCAANRHFHRRARFLDEFVTGVVTARLAQPDARDLLAGRQRPDVAGLASEGSALRVRLEQLAVEFADGFLTAAQLRAATERLRGRLAEVEGQVARAGETGAVAPLLEAPDAAAAWEGLPLDRQRAVVDALMVVRIARPGRGARYFDPSTVEITWKVDTDE